jgi:hypothetical protein
MLFHRLGLGFSPSASNPGRRHCYVGASALDQLLETPGALQLLAEALQVSASPAALSLVELLEAIRRRAIHLAVTHSAVRGLSVEEIVVVTAYASSQFDHTSWKRELLRRPGQQELTDACRTWLMQRAPVVEPGSRLGRARWPLVGCTSRDLRSPEQFVVALAPFAEPEALGTELDRLTNEAGFAHEHYVACCPATALGYLQQHAHATQPVRWDSLVLERKLRAAGVGLLLVERDGVLLQLPARYDSRPPLGVANGFG